MKGKLPSDTKDRPDEPETGNDRTTRRRVLKASAALAATGIVDTAAAKHNPADCPRTVQCNGTAEFVFNDQTVGDDTVELTETSLAEDEVVVEKASLPCGGFVDLHDPTRKSGPSGTFGAGYPVGATPYLESGTKYTDIRIELFEGEGQFGSCIDWDNEEWPTDDNPNGTRPMTAMLHLDTNGNEEFDHYCDHITAGQGKDHAYLCDYNEMPLGPGTLDPILRSATVIGDGDG